MALALSNIKSSLTTKQMLIAAGAVVVAVGGWLGWQYFEEPPPAPVAKAPPPPAAKPPGAAKAGAVANAAVEADKLIADLLAASGLNQQLNHLPQQLISGVRQSSNQRPKLPPAVLAAIETAVTESFTTQKFQQRLSADLKKNFDQKRAQALLGDLSAPAAKGMIELERAEPSPQEQAQFVRSKAVNRLSPQRRDLIQRIDAATRASELALESAFASMKAIASGIVGDNAQKAAAIDKTIERQRAAATANIRNSTLANLAFTYRDASDADLEAYAKLYETENGKWFSGIVYASLLEEARSAAVQAGERVAALAAEAGRTTLAAAKPVRSKSRQDARACLDLPTNAAITRCAQAYR